jgi:hypothetical protein
MSQNSTQQNPSGFMQVDGQTDAKKPIGACFAILVNVP